jgi:hypothetical protein
MAIEVGHAEQLGPGWVCRPEAHVINAEWHDFWTLVECFHNECCHRIGRNEHVRGAARRTTDRPTAHAIGGSAPLEYHRVCEVADHLRVDASRQHPDHVITLEALSRRLSAGRPKASHRRRRRSSKRFASGSANGRRPRRGRIPSATSEPSRARTMISSTAGSSASKWASAPSRTQPRRSGRRVHLLLPDRMSVLVLSAQPSRLYEHSGDEPGSWSERQSLVSLARPPSWRWHRPCAVNHFARESARLANLDIGRSPTSFVRLFDFTAPG